MSNLPTSQLLPMHRVSRRQLLVTGTKLGLSTSALGLLLAACGTTDTTPTTAPAQPTATTQAVVSQPVTSVSTAPPSSKPTGQRGGGGELKLLWWQAPTILNPHQASGTKDYDASRIVYEPLATFDAEEQLIPVLAAEIPSLANGAVAADGKSVTWKLKTGVTWSDGTPFGADDVVFTFDYVNDQETAAVTTGIFANVERVEKVDDHTVTIRFKDVTPGWYTVFTATNGCILPQHYFKDGKGTAAKNFTGNLKPLGTGPFVVTDFSPGDVVRYALNPRYREPTKPYFDTILLKGGGDSPSATRAVLLTGDFDFAWNVQVEANVLDQMERQGAKGEIIVRPGSSAERIMINFTDPNKEVDGERSSLLAPHRFQSELKVRQAYALLCDRDTIAQSLYGKAGVATPNVLNAPQVVYSKNTSYEFSVEKAGALLDDAGWKIGAEGMREKNGVKMQVIFQTSVNSLRQKEQQLVKDAFEKAGIKMELKTIDQSVFFAAGAGNPDNYSHLYTDLEMYTNGPDLPDSQNFCRRYLSTEVAQKSNGWAFPNVTRYQNPAMDRLYARALVELEPEKRSALFIQMNDLAISDVVEIPLVYRSSVVAKGKSLSWSPNAPWDSNLWDTANWRKS